MRYREIPGTEMKLSAICLGTPDFGSGINKDGSFRMMDAFYEQGGNFLDTAHVYGKDGMSEKTIGVWLKKRNLYDKVTVATKGGHPHLETMNISRLSPAEIISDLDDSLSRLGVDCIDIYYLHRDDINRPVGEILETLNEQVRKGKVRCIACSNWKAYRIREAQDYARKHGLQSFIISEILWSFGVLNEGSIPDPTITVMDEEEKAFYEKTGMPVAPFTSQARGFFNKVDSGDMTKLRSWEKSMFYNEHSLKRLQRAKKLAEELRTSLTAIILAYLTSQRITTMPIVGCQTVDQLQDSLKAADLQLTGDMITFLERDY